MGEAQKQGTWDESRVKECKTVIAEAKAKGEKAHIARSLRHVTSREASLLWATPAESTKAELFSKEIV